MSILVESEVKSKFKILFLCTGNSCRSQMAEGWAKTLHPDIFEVYSAGIETHGINPYAQKVMAEAGIDISNQKSQKAGEFSNLDLDYIITVCDHASENCPVFWNDKEMIHNSFPDPPKLALDKENEEEKLDCYRMVRDKIKLYILDLPKKLNII